MRDHWAPVPASPRGRLPIDSAKCIRNHTESPPDIDNQSSTKQHHVVVTVKQCHQQLAAIIPLGSPQGLGASAVSQGTAEHQAASLAKCQVAPVGIEERALHAALSVSVSVWWHVHALCILFFCCAAASEAFSLLSSTLAASRDPHLHTATSNMVRSNRC